jgi:hypothetical protein
LKVERLSVFISAFVVFLLFGATVVVAGKRVVLVQKNELGDFSETLLSSVGPFVAPESLAASPNAKRVAYVQKTGSMECVVVNGAREGCHKSIGDWAPEPFQGRTYWGGPLFSPDSRRLAYVAQNTDRWCVIVDQEEGDCYDNINPGSLTFSPNGQRLAYVTGTGL